MNQFHNWSEVLGPILEKTILNSVLWAAIFALLGLIVTIIVIISIGRRALLRRTQWIWNICAKFSYLLIMMSFLTVGVIAGALYGVQRTFDHALVVTMKPALESQMPALREKLAGYLSPMPRDKMLTARDLVEPVVKGFVYTPKSESFVETMKARIMNDVFYTMAAYSMTQAFQHSMKNLAEFLQVNDSAVDEDFLEFSAEVMLKVVSGSGQYVDFTSLDKTIPDIFTASMQKQLKSLFYNLYLGLVIKLLIVALAIGTEMVIYFKYYIPRRQPTAAEIA
jgi:hypothetical protein